MPQKTLLSFFSLPKKVQANESRPKMQVNHDSSDIMEKVEDLEQESLDAADTSAELECSVESGTLMSENSKDSALSEEIAAGPADSASTDNEAEGGVDAVEGDTMTIDSDTNDDNASSPVSTQNDPGPSTYEQMRLANIQRNADFLASLGLDSLKPNASVHGAASSGGANKRTKRARSPVAPRMPVRRSSRAAGIKVDYTATQVAEEEEDEDEEEEEEEEEDLDDSDVLKYVMELADNTSNSTHGDRSGQSRSGSSRKACSGDVHNLSLASSEAAWCDDMKVAYSMEFHPNPSFDMLLAAGKAGICALFGLRGANHGERFTPSLLYSFKAHAKWVSCARFISSGVEGQGMCAVTAADDGLLKVWDLSKQGKKTAQLLLQSSAVHDRGIFALDISEGGKSEHMLVTGSKDKTVRVSALSLRADASNGACAAELSPGERFELHSGVVKSVAWRPTATTYQTPHTFASGAQDRSVCVKDTRAKGAPDMTIDDAHMGGVHTVAWAPASATHGSDRESSFLLASAGADPVVKVWDIRNVAAPLHAFQGHARGGPKIRFKSILPCRWLSPSTLATPGEGSDRLSLYCATTGKTLSRGVLPDEPIGLCSGGPGGVIAVATRRDGLYFVKPTHQCAQA